MQFKVNTPIRHNGDLYLPGAVIELSNEEAETFSGSGAISPMDVSFAKNPDSRFAKKEACVFLAEFPGVSVLKPAYGVEGRS